MDDTPGVVITSPGLPVADSPETPTDPISAEATVSIATPGLLASIVTDETAVVVVTAEEVVTEFALIPLLATPTPI